MGCLTECLNHEWWPLSLSDITRLRLLCATSRRLTDIIDKENTSLRELKYLILDEADCMLDMDSGPEIKI